MCQGEVMTLEEKYQTAVKALEKIANLSQKEKYGTFAGVYRYAALAMDSEEIAKACLRRLDE